MFIMYIIMYIYVFMYSSYYCTQQPPVAQLVVRETVV